jgi:Flp pilus assembly protein TadD
MTKKASAMHRNANSNRVTGPMVAPKIALAVTTAIAGALLSGCAAQTAAPASISASRAEAALAAGEHDRAVAYAEAAVLAEPRNPAYRAVLGSAYLDAGRFASAATSFDDAVQLGDTSPRTALSLALALTGAGKTVEAAALLNEREDEIATADVGLALALAGQPGRGVHLMSNAIRAGENTPKMRQNLAYAYALAGSWREARLMAAQDVPADQVSDRIAEWAATAAPEASQLRLAKLLDVPAGARDAGQPIQLALANTPGVEQLAAEASSRQAADAPSLAVAQASAAELPPVAPIEPSVPLARSAAPAPARPADFQSAFATPPTSVAAPVATVQETRAVQPAPQRAAPMVAQRADGTHLVQLGSFASEQGARRAWGIYANRYPELSGHQMVISEAVVKGKRYWRVSAAGFGRSTASSMCGRVRANGQGCFAYAEGRPLPGAVDTGVRMARR